MLRGEPGERVAIGKSGRTIVTDLGSGTSYQRGKLMAKVVSKRYGGDELDRYVWVACNYFVSLLSVKCVDDESHLGKTNILSYLVMHFG